MEQHKHKLADILRDIQFAAERCYSKAFGMYDRQPAATKDPALSKLGEDYGIKFITDDSVSFDDIAYDASEPRQLKKAIAVLEPEVRLYTREMLKRARIEQIVLCTNLSCQHVTRTHKPVGGLVLLGLEYVDTMFLDTKYLRRNSDYARRLFHHELFHAIDFRDTLHGYIDHEWRQLQGENYKYAIQVLEDHMRMNYARQYHDLLGEYDLKGLDPRPSDNPGFVSDYAQFSMIEDKAEVYSFMLHGLAKLEERAKSDAPLGRKLNRMKRLLLDFNQGFDDDFWSRMRRRG